MANEKPIKIDNDHISIPYSGEKTLSRHRVTRRLQELYAQRDSVALEIVEYEDYLKVMDKQ